MSRPAEPDAVKQAPKARQIRLNMAEQKGLNDARQNAEQAANLYKALVSDLFESRGVNVVETKFDEIRNERGVVVGFSFQQVKTVELADGTTTKIPCN